MKNISGRAASTLLALAALPPACVQAAEGDKCTPTTLATSPDGYARVTWQACNKGSGWKHGTVRLECERYALGWNRTMCDVNGAFLVVKNGEPLERYRRDPFCGMFRSPVSFSPPDFGMSRYLDTPVEPDKVVQPPDPPRPPHDPCEKEGGSPRPFGARSDANGYITLADTLTYSCEGSGTYTFHLVHASVDTRGYEDPAKTHVPLPSPVEASTPAC